MPVPPIRMASERSAGAAWINSRASMKFDLPEAFGPISTFRGVSSISGLCGPNDKKFVNSQTF